jgi:hypothetical protein
MGTPITLPPILIEKLVEGANEQDLSISQFCQLLLENYFQDVNNSQHPEVVTSSIISIFGLDNLDKSLLNIIVDGHPYSDGALSGHINRLFPLKFGCRFLWSLLDEKGRGPTISEFRRSMKLQIPPIRSLLKNIDEECGRARGDRIHSSFPNNERYAINRFLNNYIIRQSRASENFPSGALFDFGLIDISNGRLQFTEVGKQFVLQHNPIIDNLDGINSVLSKEEQALFISHIKSNMGKEWHYIRHVLDGIHIGSNTPTSLLTRILRRYGPGTEANWSNSVVPHMRSGVLGRIQSLGFIERAFTANRVEYKLTLTALQIIDGD